MKKKEILVEPYLTYHIFYVLYCCNRNMIGKKKQRWFKLSVFKSSVLFTQDILFIHRLKFYVILNLNYLHKKNLA